MNFVKNHQAILICIEEQDGVGKLSAVFAVLQIEVDGRGIRGDGVG
jgi:hypothetical protein